MLECVSTLESVGKFEDIEVALELMLAPAMVVEEHYQSEYLGLSLVPYSSPLLLRLQLSSSDNTARL